MLKLHATARADYIVQYRGYVIEISKRNLGWQAGVHPRTPDLPILRRSDIHSGDQDGAVIEAMDRVDALFRQ
jgi:hypothetical protein